MLKIKLTIWGVACVLISILVFRDLWTKLPQWLTPNGLQYHGAFHWGVFGLCILWLWLKRQNIITGMQAGKFNLPFVILGSVFVVLSVLLPRNDDFLLFLTLLSWLGFFSIIFTRASIMPTVLLAIYGFSLIFPILLMDWLGDPSALIVANTVTGILRAIGLPILNDGTILSLTTINSNVISVVIVSGCAGYATLGVFLCLFALMMLDIRLPFKKAWYIFLIGLGGTWLQNIVRVMITLITGYFWGSGALDTMHDNIAYIIFPLWYGLFAYIYLKQAGWKKEPQ